MAYLHDIRGRFLGGLNTIPVMRLNRNYGDAGLRARRIGCHNSVEAPYERFHCEACGGDYCVAHTEPAAYDCEYVIRPCCANGLRL